MISTMLPAIILVGWLAADFLIAIFAALLITPLIIKAAGKLRLYDTPDGARRLHVAPVPRLGGVGVYLAAVLATTGMVFAARAFPSVNVFSNADRHILLGILIGSGLLFVVGLLDDLRGLKPSTKFLAQIIAAFIAYYYGIRIGSVTLAYGAGVHTHLLGPPLLILWIVGVTNAYNFTDGLNGLAGGLAIVACAAILGVGLTLGNLAMLIPAMALAGALIGFLHFNFPKARLFLGDSGSMSVGFLLAVLLVKASEVRGPSTLIAVPILAMFVPLMDAALAIIRRWLRGVPLSGADARHIHHRLLVLGLSQKRTAIALWCLAAVMASFGMLIALTAPYVATSIAMLGLVGLSILVIYGTNLLSYHELVVAGEVLLTAPSRVRRVISDQILALDLAARIQSARGLEEIASLLSSTASSFGFLKMELVRDQPAVAKEPEEVVAPWAWKLEYPIRPGVDDGSSPPYKLAIWCSAEYNVRPYGAERAAKIIAPELENWLVARGPDLNPIRLAGSREADLPINRPPRRVSRVGRARGL
jgi:UDP-GlcNAc:undecaprenyl-phosphate GlcNAc-1-phosphate transferase